MNRSNSDADGDSLVNLQRRIYGKAEGDGERLSPVLYRDKLSKTFNSKGFVNFRNLAKISRPKEKKKRGDGKEREKKGVGKNETALIEVVEAEVTGDEDMSGLLGDEFKGGKWRGSTRLLLLDEHCANKEFDEMPEAIKVYALHHHIPLLVALILNNLSPIYHIQVVSCDILNLMCFYLVNSHYA